MTSISPIVHLVQATTRYQTPTPYRMPSATWAIFTTLHKIHQCWRWYHKAEIYTNPQNFRNLLTGHLVNWVVGDNLMVRIAAHCVLIMTRILACVEGQIAVHRAYHEWINSLKGTYPHHYQWKTYVNGSICSPSLANWRHVTTNRMINRIQQITICTLRLVGELFALSMCLMDAIEAFSLNPRLRHESINEVFVNSNYCVDQLIENKEFMLARLKGNKQLVAMILAGIGTNYKVEQLIETVEKTINTAETVQKVVKFSKGPVVSFGKRLLAELSLSSGVLMKIKELKEQQ